jgi:hypothetical protein
MQIPYELLYVGPQVCGQTYLLWVRASNFRRQILQLTHEPATLPSCENAFIKASATALLDGGLGNELLIHA